MFKFNCYDFGKAPRQTRTTLDCLYHNFSKVSARILVVGVPLRGRLIEIPLDEHYTDVFRSADTVLIHDTIELSVQRYNSQYMRIMPTSRNQRLSFPLQEGAKEVDCSALKLILSSIVKTEFSSEYRFRLYALCRPTLIREDIYDKYFTPDGVNVPKLYERPLITLEAEP